MAIRGVIYNHLGPSHQDDRRALFRPFNYDLGDFVPMQVKFIVMRSDSALGGHFHTYRELHYVIKGTAVFTLEDKKTKQREQFTLNMGDRLLIPPNVAHLIRSQKGVILGACTEEKYNSAEVNNHPYAFK